MTHGKIERTPMFEVQELRQLIRCALGDMGPILTRHNAENLLLGTCAQESLFGQYRHQIGGPAHGIMGIEEPTFNDIVERRHKKYPKILNYTFHELIHNDEASISIARLKYLDSKLALPLPDDIRAMAKYWGKYYQGRSDPVKIAQWIKNYHRFVTNRERPAGN